MASQVTLTFAGDSKSLERTFDKVGSSAKTMAGDLDKASDRAKTLDGAMGKVGDTVDSSESKFMGTADVLDGLNSVMGTNFDAQINMARGFGDIAGGLTNLGPLFSGVIAKVGAMFGITTAQTTATGSATAAQWSLNSALAANPIGVVVVAIAALVGGFILAYKNSETFRNIVQAAMSGVRNAVGWAVDRFQDLWNFIKDLPGKIGGAFGGVSEIITSPFRNAFNAIKNLWNRTAGGFRFEIPSWIPGVGGKGFSIPRMHMGGIVPGNPGNPVPIIAMAGERITRAGQSGGGGPIVVQLVVDGKVFTETVHTGLLKKQTRSGGLGFIAA